LALVISGWKYAARSVRYLEVSVNSPAGVPIYQFKAVIVVAGILLVIQGIAQVLRCIVTIRTGEWPVPEPDIEELETILQREGAAALRHGSEAVDVVTPEEPRR
jgi:TRAP-type mannitol/chloroaromatic compound transport system permease small subunit